MEAQFTLDITSIADGIAEILIPHIKGIISEEVCRISSQSNASKKPIKGNKALAGELGVDEQTVGLWKKKGLLDPAIKGEYGRIVYYDLDKVYECLRHSKVKAGRPKTKKAI